MKPGLARLLQESFLPVVAVILGLFFLLLIVQFKAALEADRTTVIPIDRVAMSDEPDADRDAAPLLEAADTTDPRRAEIAQLVAARKWDEALVAFAGPGTNILLALIFGLSIRFFGDMLDPALVGAFAIIALINMVLALFNLIPIPPLDGSKILSMLLPGGLGLAYESFRQSFERLGVLTGTLIILIIFYFLSPYFGAVLGTLFGLLTGVSF